jgi:hypothetical protein
MLPLFLIVILTTRVTQNAMTHEITTSITPPTCIDGNDTTANFLTYTDSTYGIKIKCPSYLVKADSQNQSSRKIVKFS